MKKLSLLFIIIFSGCLSKVSLAQTALSDPNPSAKYQYCFNQGFSTSFFPPSGGNREYTYQWQYTTDTTKAWTNLPSATNQNIELGPITQTTFYRRIAYSNGQSVSSKLLHYIFNKPLYAGKVAAPTTAICSSSPVILKLDSLPSNPSGEAITYEWEINDEVWHGTGVINTPEYFDDQLYYSASFRLKVQTLTCPYAYYSKPVTVTVKPQISSVGQNTIRDDQVLCTAGVPNVIEGNFIERPGIIYTWFSSASKIGPWKRLISSEQAVNYSPGQITTSTYFKRGISSPNYCGTDTSNIATVLVGNGSPLQVFDPRDDIENPTCGMLRYAIEYANKTPGFDKIVFADHVLGQTISPVDYFNITEGVSITGSATNPVLISAESLMENARGLFNIDQTGKDSTTTLFSGVDFSGAYSKGQGALIFVGPADYSRSSTGSFHMKDCKMYDNEYMPGLSGLYFAGNNLTIENCRFYNNTIWQYSSTGNGAEIVVGSAKGKILVLNSSFYKNGIFPFYFYPEGESPNGSTIILKSPGKYECRIEGSTFSKNNSYNCSAIEYLGNGISDSLVIINSTFSNNTNKGNGGAIHATGKVYLYNTTIADNSATLATYYSDGVVVTFGGFGGGISVKNGTLFLKNTIIANNSAESGGRDIYNTISKVTSTGNNFIGAGDQTGDILTFQTSDQVGTSAKPIDPLLTPLTILGTDDILGRLPYPASPVINKGGTYSGIPAKDQAGSARVIGTSADIGAIEAIPCPNPYLINSNKDAYACGALRFAIALSNRAPGEQTISFTSNLQNGIIVLDSALNIYEGVSMNGQTGLAISGKSTTNLIVSSLPNALSKLTYSKLSFINSTTESMSEIPAQKGKNNARIEEPSAAVSHSGPGILSFKNCEFNGNKGFSSGGLHIEDADVLIDSCRFVGNTVSSSGSGSGGGFHYETKSKHTIDIRNSYFKGNSFENLSYGNTCGGGMAAYVYDTASVLTIQNCTFEGNESNNGGGLFLYGLSNKKTKIYNSTFSANQAARGGGIHADIFGVKIINSTIHENIANSYDVSQGEGGGIYIYSGELQIQNTGVSSNTATTEHRDFSNNGGFVTSLGNNFITDTTGSGLPDLRITQMRWEKTDSVGNGNTSLSPLFYPLNLNGGLTPNHLPKPGSPLINKGNNNLAFTILTDQRGQPRIQNGTIDIGAVEAPVLVVFAGRDTVLCDTTYTLRASPVQLPLYGYWTIKGKKSKGIITDSTLYNSKTKVSNADTVFYWNVTDGGNYLKRDSVRIKSYYNPVKANAGLDRIINTDTITLRGNTVPAAIPRWRRITGQSTITDTTKAVTKVTRLSAGSNSFEYRYGTSPCITRDVVLITYQVRDTATTGKDIYACADTSRLNARKPKAGYRGKWTITKGTLLIENDTLYNSRVTGLKDSLVTLSWNVTSKLTTYSSVTTVNVFYSKVTSGIVSPAAKDTFYVKSHEVLLDAVGGGYAAWNYWYRNDTLYTSVNNFVADFKKDTTEFKYVVKNFNCVASDSVIVIVLDTTKAFAGSDQAVCGDSAIMNAAEPVKTATGYWTLIDPVDYPPLSIQDHELYNTKITGLPVGTSVFVWTVTNKQNVTHDTVSISNILRPRKANAGPDLTVESDMITLLGNRDGNIQVRWRTKGKAVIADSANARTRVTNLQLGKNTFFYVFQETCERSDTLVITYNLPSDTAKAGPDQNVCGDTTRLAAATPSAKLTGAWRSKANVVFSDSTSTKSKVSNLPVGTVKLYWVLKAGSIATSIDSVIITSNLNSVKANAGFDKTVTTDTTTLYGNSSGNTQVSWRSTGLASVVDSANARTKVINLQAGKNKFAYVFKSVCQSVDSVIVTYNLQTVIADAGPDQTLCEDFTTLSASIPIGNVTGAWRSNKNVVFTDSTLYNSKIEKLPLGATTLYWVIKTGNIVQSKDSVTIRNREITVANIPLDYKRVCVPDTSIEALPPAAGEFGSWSSKGKATLGSVSSLPIVTVHNLAIFDTVNTFYWTISNGTCASVDSINIYYAIVTITVTDDTSGIAGDIISIPVTVNDKYSLGDKLILESFDRTNTAIKGASVKNNNAVFETNPFVYANNLSFKYVVSNRCQVSDTGIIVLSTKNVVPKPTVKTVTVSVGNKHQFRYSIRDFDDNPNIDSITVIPDNNLGKLKAYLSPDLSEIIVEVDYSMVEGFDGTETFNFRVCDLGENGLRNCQLETLIVITKSAGNVKVYNAVSPNNDGKNDIFLIENITLEEYKNNVVQIFNRWGDLVYHEKGYNNTTVKFDGGELPDGTYYYVLDLGNGSKLEEGYIILKR